MKEFIVYKTTNIKNGMIYIGVHGQGNEKYLGSGTNILSDIKLLGKECFIRETLFTYKDMDSALLKEAELVNEEFILREDTYNIILGGGKFNVEGRVTVICDKSKTGYKSISKNEFNSGKFIGIAKGKVNAKDKSGKIIQVDKNNSKLLSGELSHLNKDMTIAIEIATNKSILVNLDDSRWKSGELIGINKNKILVNKNNKSKLIYPNVLDEFLRNGWNVGSHITNTIHIHKNSPKFISKVVNKNEIDYYIKNGWVLGRGIKTTKGKVWITCPKTFSNKMVTLDDINVYLSEGWVKGRKL